LLFHILNKQNDQHSIFYYMLYKLKRTKEILSFSNNS
jgi:hypothetical protein